MFSHSYVYGTAFSSQLGPPCSMCGVEEATESTSLLYAGLDV
jgi:hypothetical protein